MIDVELLIIEVEKYECLWNVKSKLFMERDTKRKSWDNICRALVNNYEDLTVGEVEEQTEDFKKKWKNIRDNYTREVNETRNVASGSEASRSKKKKYSYAAVLNFLQPVVQKRKTTGNMSSIETSLDNTLTELQTGNSNNMNDGESTEIPSNTICTPATQSFPPQKKKKTTMMTPFQETLLDAIKNPPHRPIETEDADKAFLMSFLPEIKKLNPEQKSEIKFQFHQCVRNISQYNNIPQCNPNISNYYSPLNYQQAPQPQSSISIPSPINYTQPTYHHSYSPISNPISNNFTQSIDQTPPQSQGYSPFPDPPN